MKKIVPLLLLALFLTGCQTNTFTCKHFPERVARIHTVGLAPVEVHTAMLNKIGGKEPFVPLAGEEQIRSELATSAIDQLRRRGFTVKESPFEPPLPAFTNQVWDARTKYRYLGLPFKAPWAGATMLASNLDADALVYVNASAYKSTERRQNWVAFNNFLSFLAAVGGAPAPVIPARQAAVQITLVDGKTGDDLWMTLDDFNNFETNKPAKAVGELFNRYPKQK